MAGRVNAHHVRALTYGIKHLGLAVMLDLEQASVTVAENKEPGELFEVLKDLKDIKHPEDLDVAHLKGMDKEDFSVSALPDGFHISGFLNAVTGSKPKKGLDSVSAPRDKDDTRTGSQRRVQGLDDVLSSRLMRRGTSRAPHHLLHRGGLHITGDAVAGFTFTARSGRPVRRRRTHYHRAA